jgi:DNA mismatch repair protein MutL
VLKRDQDIAMPRENINHAFNPFENEGSSQYSGDMQRREAHRDWEKLYERKNNEDLTPGLGFQGRDENGQEQENGIGQEDGIRQEARYLQMKGKYVLTPVKSGLMVIDQRRAHIRILYEQNLATLQKDSVNAQNTLFPETIELNTSDYKLCLELVDEIGKLGFDIRDFGHNCVIVHSIPANTAIPDIKSVIETLLEQYKNFEAELKLDQHEKLARSTAIAAAIRYGKQLSSKEMQELVDQLFACSNPNTTPGGKAILNIVKLEDFEKHLA